MVWKRLIAPSAPARFTPIAMLIGLGGPTSGDVITDWTGPPDGAWLDKLGEVNRLSSSRPVIDHDGNF